MYPIDTNIVSKARRGTREAVAWLKSIDPMAVYLSVITIGEIMRSIALKSKTDPRAAHLTVWLRELRQANVARILPITDDIAVQWGRIASQRSRGDAYGLIAATAVVHDLIVVTRNSADFEDTGVSVINPRNEFTLK